MSTVLHIRKRADFLRAKDANKSIATAGLVLQVVESKYPDPEKPTLRIGFTASAKVGNAVKRNRIKRRLRAAARIVMGNHAIPDHDYVIIARFKAFDRDFISLVKDLKYALHNTGTFQKT